MLTAQPLAKFAMSTLCGRYWTTALPVATTVEGEVKSISTARESREIFSGKMNKKRSTRLEIHYRGYS
jgi:hypothetical protein